MTQHDPALLSAALAGAELALNQTIALTPTSHQELEALSGTLLGIDITSLNLTLFVDMLSREEIHVVGLRLVLKFRSEVLLVFQIES